MSFSTGLRLTPIPSSAWSAHLRDWLHDSGITRVVAFQVPLTVQFRSVTSRQGLLLEGDLGWGEFSPFLEYEPQEAAHWWRSAVAGATQPVPPAIRDRVPVNVTIPVSDPQDAAQRATNSGCATAKIKVADPRVSPREDADRVRAVAQALADRFGSEARVRVDVNGSWTPDEALKQLDVLESAAGPVGGLEYVEQPCASVQELAAVRSRTHIPVAADESIRRAEDPFKVVELEAADIAVIKVAPLGGVNAALEIAERLPLPVVVSSALDTSIGLSAGVQLAGALPLLPYACGLDTARLLAADVTRSGLVTREGSIGVSDANRVQRAALVQGGASVDADVLNRWIRRAEQVVEVVRHDS